MLRTAPSGRLFTQGVRAATSSSSLSIRASTSRLASVHLHPAILTRRSFASFHRLLQQAAAEAPNAPPAAESDEIRHAPPELSKFSELAEHGIIHPKIIENITQGMNIHTMTEVQRMTINECLDGDDVIAQARTGTGKTLAFLIPIIQRFMRDKTLTGGRPTIGDTRALIVSPTRELAQQIAEEAKKVCARTQIQIQTAVGGTGKGYNLMSLRQRGCHILIGTPGRLKDLLSDPGSGLNLDKIQTFVMDEADRLLDIGFAPDIAEIQTYMPPHNERERQTLMFSATVPKSVVELVRQTLRPDFKFIRTVDPNEQPTHANIPQNVTFLPGLQNIIPSITEIAVNAIEAHKNDPQKNLPFKAIVFFQSKNEVSLARAWLDNLRPTNSDPGAVRRRFRGDHPFGNCQILDMSGDLNQNQRTINSQAFRNAESAILLASDVVARGMDFPNVSHVIQVGMPSSEDQYIHRVGRTGRAGKSGQGWLLLQEDERHEYRRSLARDLRLTEDTSLHTASLDMTKGAQLPGNVAQMMQWIENGIRAVPFGLKASTFLSMIGVLKMATTRRSGQEIVDMMNEYSRYGWGLDRPPPVSSSWAGKMGLSNARGLEIDDSGRGRMQSFGGRDSGRPSFDRNGRNDSFGMGLGGGKGVSRGFGAFGDSDTRGGSSNRGHGNSNRGYGNSDRRGGRDFFGR
jgi:ATP-dependent RNA helicase MSS116, mitochondrial